MAKTLALLTAAFVIAVPGGALAKGDGPRAAAKAECRAENPDAGKRAIRRCAREEVRTARRACRAERRAEGRPAFRATYGERAMRACVLARIRG